MKLPLAAGAIVLALTACKPETPTETTAPPALATDPSKPESYLGLDEKAAGEMADQAGLKWHVIEVDGQSRPVTLDHRPDRLNFAIGNGRVIRVTQG